MNELTTADDIAAEAPVSEKPFPGIWPSLGWIALYFIFQVVATVIVSTIAMIAQKMATNPGAPAVDPLLVAMAPINIIWGLILAVALQIACMWVYLCKDDRAAQLGLSHFGKLSIGRTLAIAIVAILLATGFNHVYATYIIPGIPMQDDMAKLLASIPRTPLNIGLGLIAIAVAAPLIEELLFRGLLQKSFAHKMPVGAAILLSAFLFSLVHMQPYAMPALMSLGAAFGYIYHKTGSLRMTILLHMINNALALILTQAV